LEDRQYKLSKEAQGQFLSSMNSYLGILKQYATYKLRRKMLIKNLSPHFWKYVYISDDYDKLTAKVL